MYAIEIEPPAQKFIRKLETREQDRILKKIEELRTKPNVGKMLTGQLAGIRSLRAGDYRVLYKIKENLLTIFILRVGNRKNIYDQISR